MPVVTLQTEKAQAGTAMHPARQAHGGLARLHAAPAHADVYLDQHADHCSGGNSGPGNLVHMAGGIHTDTYLGAPRQVRQAAQLQGANDLIGDEEIVETGVGDHLGLAQFGAQEALGAPRGQMASQAPYISAI
jgi:hypothetical protein